ncbi:YkgJ family cysteine cluster protein [Photobacterium obscurum]|uniref:YkgJ family cysteine cluster protein n=1 Tax=Photobacterium obscurum TaxID=2829490 RepID=UPI00389B15E7
MSMNHHKNKSFPCDKCGLCCRNIRGHELYLHLDRGDGVCCHFDENNNLCAIYDERPDICNIDTMYRKFFSQSMTLPEYYVLNIEACKKLQGIEQ